MLLPLIAGEIVELNGKVGDEQISCSFKMMYRNMKVNMKRSKISCNKPSTRMEISNLKIKSTKVLFQIHMIVLASGKVRILKAKAKKYETGKDQRRTRLYQLGLPSFWTNETEIHDMRSNSTKKRQTRITDRGYTCTKNDWDGEQWCLCKENEKVGTIISDHSNHHEDRQWDLRCQKISDTFPQGREYKATPLNGWDGHVYFNGRDSNAYLVGMASHHSNHHEDRQFHFFYRYVPEMWELSGPCRGWMYVNQYDGHMDINTRHDEVIVGLHSYHDNHREDRRWQAAICILKSKCSQEGELKIDLEKVEFFNEKTQFAYFDDIDASNSKTDITKEVGFDQTTLNGMSGTETFERTSGHKFSAGFSVTNKVGITIEKLFDASSEVTYSAGYEYSTSKTFSRSKTTNFEEGTHGSSKWTVTCLAGHTCKLKVQIITVTATAPYTLEAGSRCVEKGVITVENALSGNIIKEDIPVGPGTTECVDDGRYQSECPIWAKSYCHFQYESFMKQYCRKSCKFCV